MVRCDPATERDPVLSPSKHLMTQGSAPEGPLTVLKWSEWEMGVVVETW